jgi:agmatine deiminase
MLSIMESADSAPGAWRMPAEWEPQEWLWIGFPHAADLWLDDLTLAQEQIGAFASAVAETGQEVRLVVRDAVTEARARQLASGAVRLERHPYGDIWLRDTGPLTLVRPGGARRVQRFGFNGWGGKYEMEGDQETGASLAATAGLAGDEADWILEGGAIDTDGSGLVLTTEQCLLNPNRNPVLSRTDIEARLARDLGFTQVLWLGQGLAGDHTDGHVDNLARFVAPGVIALPRATTPDDPNAQVYEDARARRALAGPHGRWRLRGAGELHELYNLQRHRDRADLRHRARRGGGDRHRRPVPRPCGAGPARGRGADGRGKLSLLQPARAARVGMICDLLRSPLLSSRRT